MPKFGTGQVHTFGHQKRHRDHMNARRAQYQEKVGQHRYDHDTDDSDSVTLHEPGGGRRGAQDAVQTTDDPVTDKLNEIGDSVKDLAGEVSGLKDRIDQMRHQRIALDEQSVAQITALVTEQIQAATRECIETHIRTVAAGVASAVGERFMSGTKDAIKSTPPCETPSMRAAKFAAIIAGFTAVGIAGFYAYAVSKYKPPKVNIEVDPLTGEATATSEGGNAI